MDMAQAGEVLGEQFAFIAEDAERVIRHLGLAPEARILDVGTGMGYCAIALALNGHRVLTGEPASDDSVYARQDWLKKARDVGVDQLIEFQPFDAQNMPFDAASFDAVFFFGVLHHVEESARRSALQEAFRVAKPGAVICFLEPTQETTKMVREQHPTHPDPADPTAYAQGLRGSPEILKGRHFDITILRRPTG